MLLDTPGQIEIFTWSASGQIITESLASRFPTAILYIVDTPRCANPVTFMSNMLYAVSILYKMKLPFLLVFNKTDVKPHDFAVEWMDNFESYLQAVQAGTDDGGNARGDTYSASFMNSMALVLDEFYRCLKTTGVSSITGAGFESLVEKFDECVKEYNEEYLPHIN